MNELSPATWAVIEAYGDAPFSGRPAIAAALRAAADCLTDATSAHTLYAIAAQLEA